MSDTRYPQRTGPGVYDDLVDTPLDAAEGGQSDDPLAELARLIDEDPFADFNQRRREPPLASEHPRTSGVLTEPPVEVPPVAAEPGVYQDEPDVFPEDSLTEAYAPEPYAPPETHADEQAVYQDSYAQPAEPTPAPASYDTLADDVPAYEPSAHQPAPQEPAAYEAPSYEAPVYVAPAYEAPPVEHAAQEPPAYEPLPDYQRPADSYRDQLEPIEPDLTAIPDEPAVDDYDQDSTERLYADLAAASQRVEPSLGLGYREPDAGAREAAPINPTVAPAVAPQHSYDPVASLEAQLLSDDTQQEPVEEFDFGDLTGAVAAGASAPEPAMGRSDRVEPTDFGAAAYQDNVYEQTDPVFDDTGHVPPYNGEVPVEPTSRRRGTIIVAGLIGLVVLGGAGAFGYRSLFGGDTDGPAPVIRADKTPSKVQPQTTGTDEAPAQGKLVYDRVGGDGASENAKIVSREEPVADVGNRQVRVIDPNKDDGTGLRGTATDTAGAATGASSEDLPKRVRTVVVKPDGTIVGEIEAPKPAQPLQPAPLPGSSDTTAALAPVPSATAPSTDAPAATTSAIPLPMPRPADLPRSQPAPAPAAAAPVQAAPQPAPIQPAPAPQANTNFVPPSAPSSNSGGQPISLQPTAAAPVQPAAAPAPAAQTASVPATTFPAGSYVVQVAASRNEQDAQGTSSSINQRYSSQLSGYSSVVERADLGDRGIYYRVGVGPLKSQGDANSLCAKLKSAGLDCFVRRN